MRARISNTAFNHLLPAEKAVVDLYPEEYRAEIDQINAIVYETVNSALFSCFQFSVAAQRGTIGGVYKAGQAKSQEVYETAVYAVFETLDKLEFMLTGKDYLVGDRLTEADIHLWVTLASFPQKRAKHGN
jgi:putative glutathione S-transferase